MAVPVFPQLPKPLKMGYSEEIQEARLSYQMDFGNKVRTDGHSKPDLITVSYVLTTEEYLILKNFLVNTLVNGVKAFDYPNPTNDGMYIRASIAKAENLLKRTYYQDTLLWLVEMKLELYHYVPIG